jgi:hypothetical protein
MMRMLLMHHLNIFAWMEVLRRELGVDALHRFKTNDDFNLTTFVPDKQFHDDLHLRLTGYFL